MPLIPQRRFCAKRRLITVAALVLEIPIISVLAYLLSMKQAPGSKLLMYMVVLSFLFTGGMIPTDMIVKETGGANIIRSVQHYYTKKRNAEIVCRIGRIRLA